MKIYILIPIISALLTLFVDAQRNDPPPHSRMLIKPPTKLITSQPIPRSPLDKPKVQDKLLGLFKSSNGKSRQVGYKAVRDKFKSGELKQDDRRLYRVLIGKAADYHLGELKSHVEDMTNGSPLAKVDGAGMFRTFNKAYGDWYISSLNCRETVQTDWRKVQQFGSFEGMEKEFKECLEDHFVKLAKSWETIKDSSDYSILLETCEAINECRAEVAWCDSEEDYEATPITRLVTAVPAGVSLKKSLERIESFDKQVKNYSYTYAFNEKQQWASDEVRKMVQIINDKRFKIGLVCYQLDEVLSRVCTEHSQDMVKRKFFSHTGSDGKDYEARVSAAEWFGGTFGEVIYAGSTTPRDVHTSWWKSEANRPKLYEPHLNRIGIGLINKTWTAIVGSSYDRKEAFYIVE
jgi:uncharacterized protein YkwD